MHLTPNTFLKYFANTQSEQTNIIIKMNYPVFVVKLFFIANLRYCMTWTSIEIADTTEKWWNSIGNTRAVVEDKTLGSIGMKLFISLSVASKVYYILSCYRIKLEILWHRVHSVTGTDKTLDLSFQIQNFQFLFFPITKPQLEKSRGRKKANTVVLVVPQWITCFPEKFSLNSIEL